MGGGICHIAVIMSYFWFYRAIYEPYFKCLSEMFPSCDIKEIARKLMMSAIFTDKLQPGFDVLTCLKGLFKHLLHDNKFLWLSYGMGGSLSLLLFSICIHNVFFHNKLTFFFYNKLSLSVTCGRSVVFSESSGFPHQ